METLKDVVSGWVQEAKKNAGWILALGVITLIAGLLAMAAPLFTGLTVTVVIGFALVIAGIARTVGAFHAGSFGQGALAFIGAILTLVAGVILATRPGVGLASLTLLLGAYLLVDGIAGCVLAFRVRPEKGWGWMLFSAAMAFVLGIMLLKDWPLSGNWAIGTLVGVNLVFAGFSLISVGAAGRALTRKLS